MTIDDNEYLDPVSLLTANTLLKTELDQQKSKIQKLQQQSERMQALEARYLSDLARQKWVESGGVAEEFEQMSSGYLPSLSLNENFELQGWDKLLESPGIHRHFVNAQGRQSTTPAKALGSAWDRLTAQREQESRQRG